MNRQARIPSRPSHRSLLVTGGGGFIGGHVGRIAADAARLPRSASDLLEAGDLIRRRQPSAILHLAALSRLPVCHENPREAWRVNVEGTRVVARAAREISARLVHISTDQVFDGRDPPYRPDDRPTPRSVYGETKAASEQVALSEGGHDVLVVRLHLVVGRAIAPRRSATDELLVRAGTGGKLSLFTDEYRTPLHVIDAARALVALAVGPTESSITGIVHLGGPERLSRFQIGHLLVRSAGLDPATLIEPESLSNYNGPPRCPDTSFDSERCGLPASVSIRPLAQALALPG